MYIYYTYGICSLKYLDDRPVFDDERLRAEAFMRALNESNGDMKTARDAEMEEVERQRKEKKEAEDRNFNAFQKMIDDAKAEAMRKKKEAEQNSETAEMINPFSGEKIIPTPDPVELRRYREV
jgi:dynein assembly factor 1